MICKWKRLPPERFKTTSPAMEGQPDHFLLEENHGIGKLLSLQSPRLDDLSAFLGEHFDGNAVETLRIHEGAWQEGHARFR